jgi:hypothetical protein
MKPQMLFPHYSMQQKWHLSCERLHNCFIYFLNSLPSKSVNQERRFRALVLQNHSKSIRLFEHSKNNLTG